MHLIANPADMTPEHRRSELAAILAAGFLRLRTRRGHVPLPDLGRSRSRTAGCTAVPRTGVALPSASARPAWRAGRRARRKGSISPRRYATTAASV